MRTRLDPRPLLVIAILFSAGLWAPVQATTCGPSPVVARGEESRFIWMAKTKARANWRAKVRALPSLGPDYSNWSRAADTEERCLTGPAGTVCIFTGTPCRP